MERIVALRRRFNGFLLAFFFFLSASFLMLPGRAATVPQTLKVYAQYWGDPDSAVLLREFSREELEELSNSEIGYEGYYCNVTNVNTVMRIHARGFRLAEFLSEQVGLDLTSVRQLDFHTTDISADARFVSKGREELLDSKRYYYPNLIPNSHIDDENNERIVDDGEAASEGAVQVPTIIAVVQYSTKNANDDLTGEMTADTSFRLCAGHPDTELWDGQHLTKTSFESAKWVDEIYVVLAGSPPEESEEPEDPEEPDKPDEKPTGSDITPPEEPTDPETPDEQTPPDEQSTEDDTAPTPEEPTKSDSPEEPTVPDEQPTIPDPTVAPKPTNAPTTTKKPTTSPSQKETSSSSTTKRAGVIRSTTRTTQSTATTIRSTTRTTVTTTGESTSETSRQIAGENAEGSAVKMGQLVVNDYDSLIKWKQDPGEEVSPLRKKTVTTKGARNAAILFVASFGAGAGIMYKWFKEEQ